ncbi:MAG: RHS repeat-associated core domain-containing protein [Acidobacteria bacterium]|nr:RHS repeat-associated core domain-containing protein [Acidobacteriota bacterium]
MGRLALSSQSLSIGCGSFFMTQKHPQTGLESSATGDLELVLDAGSQGCDPPPGPVDPPEDGDIYVDRFHHRDHLGSLRVVTDSAGNRIEGMDYYPFGMELVPDGESRGATSRMKYTGHERDESAGMDYMLARYATYLTSTFLSVDPAGGSISPGLTGTWNRYNYCVNSPIRHADPTGEAAVERNGDFYVWARLGGASHAEARIAVAEQAEANRTAHAVVSDWTDPTQTGSATAEALAGNEQASNVAVAAAKDVSRGVALFGIARMATSLVRRAANAIRAGITDVADIVPTPRPDIVVGGGRSGERVKTLTGPPNAVLRSKGSSVFVTNEKGEVILDIRPERTKPVTPGRGFGSKRTPTDEEMRLYRRMIEPESEK